MSLKNDGIGGEKDVNFPPDDIHRAGELAEMRLAKLSRAAGKKNGWKIYESVRIPDPDGGRREIDLVIIGETKFWLLNKNTGLAHLLLIENTNLFKLEIKEESTIMMV